MTGPSRRIRSCEALGECDAVKDHGLMRNARLARLAFVDIPWIETIRSPSLMLCFLALHIIDRVPFSDRADHVVIMRMSRERLRHFGVDPSFALNVWHWYDFQ